MRDKFSPPDPSIKPAPASNHRRQMIWQVWVPLAAGITLALALGILSIVGAVQGSSQVERWGNISAVLIILPVLLTSLLTLALVGGLAYGVTKLLRRMPEWMLKAQMLMVQLGLLVRQVANAATQPVIAPHIISAQARAFWQAIFQRKSAQP